MTGWILRPIIWFATASMVTTIYHELVHAIVAYALGVRSTLHNYFVHLDLTPDQAATNIPAIIGVAGPSLCLVLGSTAWVAYKYGRGFTPRHARGGLSLSKASRGGVELPLLLFAVFGVGTFFGNLVSASFSGDFSRAAIALDLPMPARYGLSLAGVAGTAAVHYVAGRELARWVPPTVGRVTGMFGVVAAPVIIGMGLVILVNMPLADPGVRIAEAAFWIVAAIGALMAGAARATPYVPDVGRPSVPHVGRPFRGADQLQWADVAALLAVILIVRVLVRGIPFVP